MSSETTTPDALQPLPRSDTPMMEPTQGEDLPRTHASVLRNSIVPKSASYTHFPVVKDNAYSKVTSIPVRIRTDHSSEHLPAHFELDDASTPDSSGWNTPSADVQTATDSIEGLDARLEAIRKSSCEESISVSSSEKSRSIGEDSTQDAEPAPEMRSPSSSSLASRLGRRMSLYRSRSTSPTKKDRTQAGPAEAGDKRSRSLLGRKEKVAPQTAPIVTDIADQKEAVPKQRTIANKPSRPPQRQTRINIHTSFSTDKLPSVVEIREDATAPPSPRIPGERNSSVISLGLPRKRDELWGIFRSLDGDFTKFSSKSTPFKANVIRQSLLPFLRNYADHPTNHSLRPEDLTRRVAILNKWWVGLLELLHGRHNQSMSGTDRPTILDALSGIMDRPEWRPALSIYAPISYRNRPLTPETARKSPTSLASSGPDFLTDSVLHNVRNMFVQNLTAQITFVVEKMSLRNASASLITFCGKAIAWAFFFCPGIAELLVREWDVPSEIMKRVLQAHGVSRFDKLDDISELTSETFPPAIRPLAFVSLSKLLRALKNPAPMPPMAAELQMYGFWRDRWLGRESDLFYVFVKHYFILAQDYLPHDADKSQRLVAPGMVLVQAQILSNLDSTINRDVAKTSDNLETSSPTFDDFLGGPDAVVSNLPILPPNATRIMSENRLIMLIRDFLSDRMVEVAAARHLFAGTFCDLLVASASVISTFNHAACYTLCDFLEEALIIINRYEASDSCPGPVLDFTFWLDVFRRMLNSHNTVTEIRTFAFLYSSWNQLCTSPERREALCSDLLLSPEVFGNSFTHWCPMVRAYYMRLLCWRLARCDEDCTDAEKATVLRVCDRLQAAWAHHLFELAQAESQSRPAPSLTPCHPAPGRRFLIIRTDTQIAPGGGFLAFNGIAPPAPERGSRSPTMRPLSVASSTSSLSLDDDEPSGLRGFLRGIMGARKRSQSRERKPAPATTAQERPRDRPCLEKEAYRTYCFKFSLEFAARARPRTVAHAPPVRLMPPRMPGPAAAWLSERDMEEVKPMPFVQGRYVSRALAEWALVVGECQGFCERRLQEGIPSLKEVETPTLAVESFKRSA